MTVLIEIDAYPSLADASGLAPGGADASVEGPVTDLARALQNAYVQRAALYDKQLTARTADNARYGFGPRESGDLKVSIKLDGVATELVIDTTLYTSLFDLYVFYGWQGVLAAEDAVHLAGQQDRDLRWSAARTFFAFTRNALALIIRETLVQIEALAAASIVARLGSVSRRIAGAMAVDLRFDVTAAHMEAVAYAGPPVSVPASYKLHDRARSDRLFGAMRPAVVARETCSRLIDEQQRRLRDVARADVDVANESSPGWTSPSSAGKSAAIRRQQLGKDAAAAGEQIEKALIRLQEAQHQVYRESPFALLVLPGLPAAFGPKDMDNALGTALFALAANVDAVAAALPPGTSNIKSDLRGLAGTTASGVSPPIIEELYLPGMRLERELISIAMNAVASNPSYIALLAARTWEQLIEDAVIAPGSFARVVAHHWIVALEAYADQAAATRRSVGSALAIASSGLSLLAVVAPPVAPLALAADLAMLAFAAHSAIRELEAVEPQIQVVLPALATGGYDVLAAAGALAVRRAELREALTFQLLSLIVMQHLSQIRLAKDLLRSHAYVNDAMTLVAAART